MEIRNWSGQKKAKARDTSGMGTWQRMKRMGKGTITFRMSWEAR